MRVTVSMAFVAGLAACTSVDSSGNPTGDGTGLGNPEVQAATRIALSACVDAVAAGIPLSALQSQGFEPHRSGYQQSFDSQRIFLVVPTVTASMERRGGCTVEVEPGTLFELNIMRSLVADAIASRGTAVDASLSTTGDGVAATIR